MTEHFTLQELTHSHKAETLGIDNTPPQELLPNLQVLAEGLEVLRALLGHPILISSGYRCQALNSAVHGVAHSAHEEGFAADFSCPDYGTPIQVVQFLASVPLVFDQIIQEGSWVHVSFAPADRCEILTAHFTDGKATYTKGLA